MTFRNRVIASVTGTSNLKSILQNLNADIEKGVDQGLSAIGLIVQNDAKQAVQKPPKTGKIRKKKNNKNVMHQSSAWGEAPATDTGNLVNSIQMDVDTRTKEVTISAQMDYAARLEFRLNRPFLRPAVEKNKGRFGEIIGKYIKANIK